MNVKVAIALIACAVVTEGHPTTKQQKPDTNITTLSTNNDHDGTNYTTKPSADVLSTSAIETDRSKKVEKYLIPVLMGFKLTSFAAAVFTALKIFVVQSFIVSKVALLGATLLAIKVIYEHMRHKISHKGWDEHYHYKQMWPQWSPYPYSEDWSAAFDSYPSPAMDNYSLASEPDRTTLPHVHGNKTFSMRSDKVRGGLVSKSPNTKIDYGTLITRITERTSDD